METAAHDHLIIRVLGPLDVERDGEPVAVASAMQRRLLAALAMAGGATVSTDALVAALWGEDPPPSARNSLQSHVARLRAVLGSGAAIITRPPGYALDPARVSVDAQVFAEQVTAARAVLAADPERAASDLADALAAWRGEAYGEFAADFAREEATRLAELRAEALELRTGALLSAGDAIAAVDTARRLLAAHPHRETAAMMAARALAATGRVPDALEVLREHRTRLADQLGLDPSPAVAGLEEELLRGVPAARTAPSGPGRDSPGRTPPVPASSVVGRDDDLGRVTDALTAARLVTIVGPGGVGKTTLAMVVAAALEEPVWVDLATVRSTDDVARSVAEALGLPPRAEADAIVDALEAFPGTLVVDNSEHVLDAVAELVGPILSRAGDGRVLATSRERLGLPGETVVPLGPLPVPAPGEATEADPVVQLFRERLAAAGGTEVAPATAARVAAAVDGLPLALELAAARAASLPVDALLQRLGDDLDVLAGSGRPTDRHHTLTRVIQWSYDLLAPDEQLLFRRMSVFTATFRLGDVEAICADAELSGGRIAPALGRLVDASMVTRVGDHRFRVLEPLRLFAADELTHRDEAVGVRQRQRDAVLATVSRADREMTGPAEADVVPHLEHALPDIRAVHARAAAQGDLTTIARLAGGLYRFAYVQARPDLLLWGLPLATPAADDVDPDLRGRAVATAAAGCWMTGDLDRAARLASEAEAMVSDPWGRITVTEVLGDTHAVLGDFERADAGYAELIRLAGDLGHTGLVAQGEIGHALIGHYRGETQAADAHARAAIEQADEARAPSVRALAHYVRGEILAEEDADHALVELDIAREIATTGRARLVEGVTRTAEVALRGRHGDPDEALRRYGEALTIWRDPGVDGLLLNTLRNLVVLLVRIGADTDAVTLDAVVHRLGSKPSFGTEARDLEAARRATHERLTATDRARAAAAGAHVADLREAAAMASEMVDRLLRDRRGRA